jgi:hypothetical protein
VFYELIIIVYYTLLVVPGYCSGLGLGLVRVRIRVRVRVRVRGCMGKGYYRVYPYALNALLSSRAKSK